MIVAANTSGNNGNNNSNNGGSHSGSNDSSNNTNISTTAVTNPAQEMDKIPAAGDPSGSWLTLFAISRTGLAGMLVKRKKN